MNKRVDRVITAFEKVILSRVKSNSLFAEYYNRTDKKANWKRQATTYNAKEIKDWKTAVMSATDPDEPRRGELMRFYQSLMLDNHLASVIDTRILRVTRSSFKIVNENGDENEDLKKLLERPWYEDLIRLIVGKQFQGTTLIELFDTDEAGELVRVSEIPQSNFIAQKGIILKEEWDTTGISYIDGIYKDYYVQVGSDWELGMLNQLAMIVLAKKLGLGSWMSYIEKFGVPPLFAITDRMDTGRRDELFEMLENFRMNHFGVLQGNEKIETPQNWNLDAYNSFKTLMNDVCNSEISKRVLGGTALVDEKSFVGSSMVQERVAADRYESDKLLFKYVFNTLIIPRLLKISSAYADFATHKFVWDNQETLDINGYIDAVSKLSSNYNFDIEEIRKRTGLPLIGIRNQANPIQPDPDPSGQQKKKPDSKVTSIKAPLLYGLTEIPSITGATWDEATRKLAEKIYDGEIKLTDLDKDLVLKNYASLSSAAQTGWGKEYYSNETARKMRDNLIAFSGAKAYNLMTMIESIDNRSGMSKEAFLEQAKKIVNLHNETYLNVEKQFASAKASAARDWQQYVKDTDIYPNLKLRTMEDSRVRESHAVLDGLVKPVKDWTVTPPFDPGCRCRLEQTIDAKSAHIPQFEFNTQYANNPGLAGEAFTREHSYFNKIEKRDAGKVSNTSNLMKQFAPYNNEVKTKGGNKVLISDFYDPSGIDDNLSNAKVVADALEKDIYIRPHSNTSTGYKNPEYGIGKPSILGDLKTYNPILDGKPAGIKTFIKNSFKSAKNQKCEWLVLNVEKVSRQDFNEIPNKLRGEVNEKQGYNKVVKNIIIIYEGKASVLTREQLNSKRYLEYFNKLFK
jgi:SPP1 gp7 family putative phage head morphogenesis protein